MNDETKKSGFILLPNLASWARAGRLNVSSGDVPDAFLSLLPVLICHENAATRLSYPGIRKLAGLSGLSPTTTGEILTAMDAKSDGWWSVIKEPIGHGRTRHYYKMRYPRYDGTTPAGDWIRMAPAMVLGGVWATMSPAARRLYLVLRAHERHEDRACGQWVPSEELAGVWAENVFVPAEVSLTRDYLMDLTGYAARTIRDAREWLFDNGLAFVTDEGQADGILMPFDPQCSAPEILAGIAKATERDKQRGFAPATGYARRTVKALRAKQANRQGAPGKKSVLVPTVVEPTA